MDAIAEYVSNTFGPFMSISLLFAAISSGTWGSLFKILCKKPFRMPLFFRWSEDTDEPELLIFAVFILVSLISLFAH